VIHFLLQEFVAYYLNEMMKAEITERLERRPQEEKTIMAIIQIVFIITV